MLEITSFVVNIRNVGFFGPYTDEPVVVLILLEDKLPDTKQFYSVSAQFAVSSVNFPVHLSYFQELSAV